MTIQKNVGKKEIKKGADNDKKEIARANTNQIKQTNIFTVLMDKGAKKQEKELPFQILGKFEIPKIRKCKNSKIRKRTKEKNRGNKNKKERKGYK